MKDTTITHLEADSERFSRLSRRVVLGAAWSTPVILAAVASPAVAASTESPASSLTWSGSPGVFNEDSVLLLTVPAGSPELGLQGTLTIAVVGYGYPPTVVTPSGWSYSQGTEVGTLTTPPGGLTGGTKAFTVTWGELSGNMKFVVTWQSASGTAPVTAPIEVGPRGFPSMSWGINPATFGGSDTLRLSVPGNCYAIGSNAIIATSTLAAWPTGTTAVLPSGWTDDVLPGPGGNDIRVLQSASLASGNHDFVFTFGADTAPTTFDLTWLSPSAALATPISAPTLNITP